MGARRKKTQPTVFTIGHSTRPLAEFTAILKAHGVQRVLAVRRVPRSRYNPQFNRASLGRDLRAARIGYVRLRELAGLRHAKADSTNRGWHNPRFRGFSDDRQTAGFRTGRAPKRCLGAATVR
jgi:hypothetical protein